MPFDVAGNFTRVHNFQEDRDNGIKILAARMDAEFDNFATGMNAVFFRDGRVPMQGDLRMNVNRITGIADGTVGSPAVKFQTDASTGPYLDGLSRYAIAVNGVQRGVFTTAGLDVTGTILQNGSALAPTASPVFTGNVTAPEFRVDNAAGTTRVVRFRTAGVNVADIGLQTDNTTLRFNTPGYHLFDVVGNEKLRVHSTGINVFGAANFDAPDGASNANMYLRDHLGVTQGVLRWERSSDTLRLRRFDAAGSTAEGDVQLSATGMTVTGDATASGNLILNGAFKQLRMVGGSGPAWRMISNVNGGVGGNLVLQYTTDNFGVSFVDGIELQTDGNAKFPGVAYSNRAGNYGISHTRAASPGQVGFHMYNGGGNCEWEINQPTGATSHELRFSTQVAGTYTTRMSITPTGDVNFGASTLNSLMIRPQSGNVEYFCGAHTFKNGGGTTLVQMGTDSSIPFLTIGGGRAFKHANTSYTSSNVTYSTSAPSGGIDGDMWFQYT